MGIARMNFKRNKLRKFIGYIAQKFKYQVVSTGTTIYLILNSSSPANADGGLFGQAQSAMGCIVDSASKGNTGGELFKQLPIIVFTALTLVIFGYFLYTVATAISSYGKGEEVTHVIQQPLFTFIFVVLIYVFQSLMFGTGGCSSGTGAPG